MHINRISFCPNCQSLLETTELLINQSLQLHFHNNILTTRGRNNPLIIQSLLCNNLYHSPSKLSRRQIDDIFSYFFTENRL